MANMYATIAGSKRTPLPGAVATGPTNPNATIEVTLKLRRKQALPDITERPDVALSHEEFAKSFGASQEDIDKVLEVMAALGLKQVGINPAARSIRLEGKTSSMEQAFGVKLLNYTHEGGNYRGRVGVVQIPIELQGIVTGVFGLDNRQVARRKRKATHDGGHAQLSSTPSAWYTPSQLAAHYNFPAGDGAGQVVGLLEFGGGYFPSDLKKFCSLANIPTPPKVTPISADNVTPTDKKDGAEGEVMLDIEVIAGACPAAHIVVYFSSFDEQGWVTALDAAIHDSANNPGVLSISWGYAEDADIWTSSAMTQVDHSLQEAALLGVTVCVAAGDDGSSDGITDGIAHADFPASSPHALAVGGTTIPSRNGHTPDIAWKEGTGLRANGSDGSTGGGVSAFFPRPAWQNQIQISSVNPGAIAGRCLPDLAANADWTASPYLLVVDGQPQPNGGTSAATPLIASLITRINATRPAGKRVGYLTPVLYGANGNSTVGAAGCIDVQSGDNITDKIGGYTAGPGYDAVSGWGTPDGQKLAQLIPQ